MMILNMTPKRNVNCRAPYAFNRYWNTLEGENHIEKQAKWNPATDIYDTETDYVLRMEVPGLAKADLNIEVKGPNLSVGGERKIDTDTENENGRYRLSERHGNKFQRQFTLPKNVDGKKINATLKDGVLELKIPKPEEVKPQNISIH